MPRTRASAKSVEITNPVEPEEQLELEDPEEMMEEEIEYEEIEEEVVEDEEEEVVEEDPEEDEEETATANRAVSADIEDAAPTGEGGMKIDEKEEDEIKKHAELLALPPHGSEVYIGGIPQDASEEDLRNFCEAVGEVTEVRVMKRKDSSDNKPYAFVTFRTKVLAVEAVRKLNNTELKGKNVMCSSSQAKHRLFIGNIPRNWEEDDLKKTVTQIGPGVAKLELMKDPNNSSRNRGFAFIEYYNHACAEYAKNKMSTPKFKLDNNAPIVSWADSKNRDSSSNSQIKAVYVKNLPKDVSEDQMKKLFEHHGEITKVVLPPLKSGQENKFGFVHFAERSSAMKALKDTEKYEIDGQVLECSLAKPPADKKGDTGSNNRRGTYQLNQPPRFGYGMMGGAYGSIPGFGQPMIYGRGQTPASMAMVPMMLPDGRLAYVMQQPGVPLVPPRQGGNRGSSSSGGRRGRDNNRDRRYRPY